MDIQMQNELAPTFKVSVPDDFWVKTAIQDYSRPVCAFIREFIQNSRDAGASKIELTLKTHTKTISPEHSDETENVLVFTCADNGCGMTEEIIIQKLMALGESTKTSESGKTGGFGVAKVLICFAHPYYEIRTSNLLVVGSYGRYTITHVDETIEGTRFLVILNRKLFKYSSTYTIEYLKEAWIKEVSNSCLPNIDISLETVTEAGQERTPLLANKTPGEFFLPVEETDQIKVYRTKLPPLATTQYARVRCNGLYMFGLYKYNLPYEVDIEISGYPPDILTTNRDGLKDPWGYKVSRMLDEMVQNPEFGQPSPQTLYVQGINHRKSQILASKSPDTIKMLERITKLFQTNFQARAGQTSFQVLTSIQYEVDIMLRGLENQKERRIIEAAVQRLVNEFYQFNQLDEIDEIDAIDKINVCHQCYLEADFSDEQIQEVQEVSNHLVKAIVQPTLKHNYYIEWKKNTPIPASLHPEKLKKKYWKLLDIWAQLIGMVLKYSDHSEKTFDVGFYFGVSDPNEYDFVRAKIHRNNSQFTHNSDILSSNYPVFLINFEKYGTEEELPLQKSRRTELLWTLLNAAIHEITHFEGYVGHDSSFLAAETALKERLAPFIKEIFEIAKKM